MAQPAKTPAKQEAAAAAPAPARRSGKMLLIIGLIVLGLFLIMVLGIAALLIMKKGGASAGHEAAPPPAQEAASVVDLGKPPVFAPLDPFTVNLIGEDSDDSRYLQTVIAVRVADQRTADALKGWMPEIRHRVNMILSSKRPADIQDARGREALASEIQAQLNAMLGVPPPPSPEIHSLPPGPIQAVLFNSFIVQ